MALATAARLPRLPVSGFLYRFPRAGLRAIELHVFGEDGLLVLLRREHWWRGGYVEVLRPRQAGLVERYRLYDDGKLSFFQRGDWRAAETSPGGTLYWLQDLRFLYTRRVPGQPSVWTVTWMASAPRMVRGRVHRGHEETVVVSREFAVKVPPRQPRRVSVATLPVAA